MPLSSDPGTTKAQERVRRGGVGGWADIGGGLQGGRGAHLKLTVKSGNASYYFSSDCRSDLICTVYISVQYFRGKLI